MHIAFLIERFGYYKFYGPVILEALRRGWGVECWHNYSHTRTGTKSYLFPHIEKAPSFGSGAVGLRTYASEEELSHLIADSAVDVVVSLSSKAHHFRSSAVSCKFVTLQTGIDTFLNADPTDLASSDIICVYSRFLGGLGS